MQTAQHFNRQLFVVASTFLLSLATLQLGHGISLVGVHNGKIRFCWRKLARQFDSVIEKTELLELEQDQPTITITINNVYDSHPHHQTVGIESSSTITTATIEDEQHEHEHVATDMAEMANDFEQALVMVNANSYDLNVGNLLTACDRLENTMRQIGFTQSANDISGNVKKIRNVYDRLPIHQRDSLVSIVQHEFETGVHGDIDTINENNNNNNNNNYKNKNQHTINDSSATMGFLWLGRSINYQNDMFRQMLDHEEETPYNAAKHAYEKALKPHLSWPLQKVSVAAMKRIKPLQMQKDELFCRIGGFQEEHYGCQEEQATKRDLRKVVNSWQPMLHQWKQTFSDLELAQI